MPGITAAQGAAASLKSVADAASGARRVQFITGHAHGGRLPEDIDWPPGGPHATTAVYMPLGTLEQLVLRLRSAGADPSRPVSAVFNATRDDELKISGTLESIGAQVQDLRGRGPCLLLIGTSGRSTDAISLPHASATA